jgi:Family of unknown function (DUF6496)
MRVEMIFDEPWKSCSGSLDARNSIEGGNVPEKATKGKQKIHKVMSEKKHGTLKSGSGEKVKSRKQAVAIALNEARHSGAKIPKKKAKSK